MLLMTCPICGSASAPAFNTDFARVLACASIDCRHHFADRERANQGVYGSVSWNEAAYDKWRYRNEALLGELRQRGLFPPKANVIDVGFGNGHIMKSVKEMAEGGIIAGMEAAKGADAIASQLGCHYFPDFDSVPDELQFDLAVSVEVIEHVDDPVSMLRGIRKVLAFGGHCFVTTPLGMMTGAPYEKAPMLSAYNTPQHVQFFTRASFRIACGRAGFQSVNYVAMPEMYNLEPLTRERAQSVRANLQLAVDADANSHLVAIIH